MKKSVEVTVKLSGDVQVVYVKGFMDMTELHHFERVLDQLILEQKTSIVLDLGQMDYISSAGLGAIIGRTREVRRQKGDIRVGSCSGRVKEILTIFGFADVFHLYEDTQEAIQSYKGK
jgi:anti-sigma B factor antagonist